MANVDQRIVEMKFENHLFEKNVDTSINSLEKLKSALNFDGTSRGLEDLEKSVNQLKFDRLASNVDALTNRFSAMGIAGMTVIQNLTNAAMNLAGTLARPLTNAFNQVVSGGWSRATNIDQAKFKLEGLDVAWNDIYDDIDYGVTQTAYGLDAAASAAAQLVASGVKFGETYGPKGSSPMAHALKGISGVAAMTSSSYEEIASIFTQTAGQGKLMTYQLRMLENRGLNAAAQMGKVMNKTEAEIRDMVTKGEIDFQTFSDAMFKAFGDHATEANKTFEGALSNMKSALSRIGQPVAEKYRSTMVGVFNSLRLLFNGVKNAFADSGLFDQVGRLIENVGGIATKFIDSFYEIQDGDKVVIPFLSRVSSVVSGIVESINSFFEPISDTFGKAVETAKTVTSSAKEVLDLEKHVEELAQQVIRGDFGNGEERRKALEDRKEYYELIQNKVNELLGNEYRYEISEEKITQLYKDRIPLVEKGGKVLGKYVSNQGELYETTDKAIKQTNRNVSTFEGLTLTIAGLASTFKILGSTVKAIGKGAFEGLKGLFKSIGQAALNAGADFGTWAISLKNALEESEFFTKIQDKARIAADAFSKAVRGIVDALKAVWGFLGNVGGKIVSVFGQLKENASQFFSEFKKTEGYKRISEGFKSIKDRIIDFKDNAVKSAQEALENFMGTDVTLPEFDASSFAESVSEKIVWLTDKIKELKDSLIDFFQAHTGEGTVFEPITNFFSDFSLTESINSFSESLSNAKENVKEFFSNFTSEGALNVQTFLDTIKGFKDRLFDNASETVWNFGESLKEHVPSIGDLWDVVMTIASSITTFKIVRGTGSIFSLFTSLEDILSFGDMFGAKAWQLKGAAILEVAAALGVLAVSFKMLSGLSWDQVKVGAAAIAVVTVALGSLMFVLSRFSKAPTVFNPLETIQYNLGRLTTSFNLFLKKVGTAAMMASFAAAVAILAGIFTKLQQVPWKGAAKSIAIMSILVFELVAAMSLINEFGSDKMSIGTALTVLAVSKAISTLAKVVTELGNLKPSQIAKGLVGITGITAALSIIFHFSQGVKGIKAGPILAMTFLIGEIVGSLLILSLIPFSKLLKAVLALTAVMAPLAILFSLMGKLSVGPGVPKALLGMIGTLIAVTAALTILSGIKSEQLEGSVKALLKVLGMLSIFSYTAGGFGYGNLANTAANYIGLIAILGSIALVFKLLEDMDTDHMLTIANSMTKVLKALSIISIAAGQLGQNGRGFGFLDTFTSTLGSGIANTINTDVMLANIVGIEMIAAFVNEHFPGLKKFIDSGAPLLQSIGEAIGSLFGGVLKKAVFEPLFDSMGEGGNKALDFINDLVEFTNASEDVKEGAVEKLGRIKEMMEALGDTSWGGVLANIKSAFFDTGGLETSLSEISTFLTSFAEFSGDLEGIDSDQSANKEKFEAIRDLFNAIGTTAWTGTVNNIKSAFFDEGGISNVMSELSQFLTNFDKFKGDLDSVTVADDHISKVQSIRDIIAEFGNAAWTTTVSNVKAIFFSEQPVIDIMTRVSEFITEFKKVKNSLDDIPGEGDGGGYVEKIQNVEAIISELGSLSIDTFIATFKGAFGQGTNLSTTLSSVQTFITEFVPVQEALGKVQAGSPSKVNLIARTIESLGSVEWNSFITKTIGKLPGAKDIGTLSTELLGFANTMVDFSAITASINKESVTKSEHMANMLLAFTKEVPNSGGLLSFLIGDNDLGTFGTNLITFGEALSSYNSSISNIDFTKSTEATTAVSSLLSAFNDIAGNQNGDLNNMDYASTLSQRMADVVTSLFTNINDFISEDANFDEVTNFGKTLFDKVLEGFEIQSGAGVDATKVTGITQAIVDAITSGTVSNEVIKGAGEKFIAAFVGSWRESLAARPEALNDQIVVILDNAILKCQEYRERFDTEATDTLTEIGDIISTDTSPVTGVGVVCQAMVDAARSYVGQFTSLGGDMMSGLAIGIQMNQHLAINAASAASAAAHAASASEVGSHSPAKKFIWLGEMCMRGLAIGFDQNSYRSEHAAARAANTMVGTMNQMLSEVGEEAIDKSQEIFQNLRNLYSYINTVVSESLDVDPTIRPVLDLSNIQNGVGGINSMLSGPGYAFGIDGIRYAQSMYPGTYQYGAEKSSMSAQAGILSAIRGIRSDINYLGESISNMQMVMDSGAIVGSIGGGMDRQLGNIQKYKERWA